MNDIKVIVLGANRYSFEDQKTGKQVEGCKVHYVPVSGEESDHTIGSIPQSVNMPYAYFNKLNQVPGVYDAELKMGMRGRNMTLTVAEFKFVSVLDFGVAASK